MLAKNTFWYERDGIIALFNALVLKPVFLSKEELSCIKNGTYDINEKRILEECGILADASEPTLEQFRKDHFPENEVMTMYLILTRDCNLVCDYCFEVERKGKREYKQRFMSKSTALKAIDLFANEYKRNKCDWNYQIILYGGEPALNWRTLKDAICYIRELQKQEILPEKLLIAMNTNGTLINWQRAKFLAENNVSVCVSLDGTKEVHDAHRKDAFGKPTFDSAISGYNYLKEANATVCPSFTISGEVAGNTLRIIKQLYANLNFKALGLNPLMCDRYGFGIDPHEYEKIIAKEIIDVFLWGRENGVSEDRGLRKVRTIIEKTPHIADCCAYGQQIVVQPDGSIGICHASREHNYCTIDNYKSPYSTELSKRWINRLPLFHPKCESCEAIFICGGGCAHSAKLLEGSIDEIDKGFCQHSKSMLEFLIWDIYEKMIARNNNEIK